MTATTLAAIATIPERTKFLPRVLESLRPQVDRLCVYLNGHAEVPACVLELADEHVLSPTNDGAEAKVHWADRHDGIYLSCDDDFIYRSEPAYVATMVHAVEQWEGAAIVTAHGRSYQGRPQRVGDIVPRSQGIIHARVPSGRWVNHPGTGVSAWDARRVHVPTSWPRRNAADMQLAAWAQRARVPIWLVPHRGRWLGSLASIDPRGIYMTARARGFPIRTAVLQEHGRTHGWVLWAVQWGSAEASIVEQALKRNREG